MFILFPTGTDAPCYHRPYATFGLIGFNILTFILQNLFPDLAEWFILHHGVFNPITWVSSIFMHQDVGHLLGNMFAFVLFGWVVEGRVGWWRTLVMFVVIGVLQNQLEFFLFTAMGSQGGSLGASSAIFGFIAVTLLWMPENEISLSYFGILFFIPFYGTFSVSVAGYCYFMMVVEFLTAWFWLPGMGSALLHLLGVGPGFLIGYLMLKYRQVDCDGYDLISIWSGREGESVPTLAAEQEQLKHEEQQRQQIKSEIQIGLRAVQAHFEKKRYEMAIRRFQMLRNLNRNLVMTERQLLTLIKHFDRIPESRQRILPWIEVYLKNYKTFRESLVLMKAKFHLLDQNRPRKSLKVLSMLKNQTLTAKQRELFNALVHRAKSMIADGVLEIE